MPGTHAARQSSPTEGMVESTTSPPPHRFEFGAKTPGKCWEIRQNGTGTVVRFGRVATDGQTRTATFPDEATAAQFAAQLVREKSSKGTGKRPDAISRFGGD